MAMRDLVNENICRLKPYVPGKPIEEVKREFGITCSIVKLASNENPLGASPKALAAMREALEQVALYPDGKCFTLAKALAAHLGVSENELIIGNGSDEIIHNLGITFLLPGDEIVQGDPSFSQYETSATVCNSGTCMVPLRDFVHDLDVMADRITDKTRLVYIANPNNPTGTIVTKQDVERFMARLPKRVIAIFDEAYYEYVDNPDYPNMIDYVKAGANVILLRTFSKIYGLAGLRVGYAIARPELIACLNQVRQPFCVNSIAQAGAAASLEDPEQVLRSRLVNSEGKKYLYQELDKMGLPYVPTEANFIFVDIKTNCKPVFTEMLKRGVIIRTGDIFGYPNFIRVTIGTTEENARFIDTLKKVLK
jgi:histidinol-phosphate aminotransferase